MMGLPDMEKIAEETNKVNERLAMQTEERNKLLKGIMDQLSLMNKLNASVIMCKNPTRQKEIEDLFKEIIPIDVKEAPGSQISED